MQTRRTPIVYTACCVLPIALLFVLGCTHDGDSKPAPTTRTSEAALKDPYGKWSSDVNTDITGGGTSNYNRDALKRDLDNFLLK